MWNFVLVGSFTNILNVPRVQRIYKQVSFLIEISETYRSPPDTICVKYIGALWRWVICVDA